MNDLERYEEIRRGRQEVNGPNGERGYEDQFGHFVVRPAQTASNGNGYYQHDDVPPLEPPPEEFEVVEFVLRDCHCGVPPDHSPEDCPVVVGAQAEAEYRQREVVVHEDDQSGLEFLTARALAAKVDNAPPVGFLFRPVWPADAYGVQAAEQKAGKTWLGADMAVSAASGTPWLGVYPVERSGPVLVFLGEGGMRNAVRRLRAICASRGLVFEDLPIEVCFRAPHLTSLIHIARIAEKVAELRPVLVVVDPLYLAARGAKAASLYDMGAHLENVQAVVQAHDAALCVIHHWNQTGTGRGAERMSGAGPAEWGRVLVSTKVEHRHTDDTTMATAVTLAMEFVGSEIPDTELRIRRRVWTDDPDDLASPMHYEVERLEAKAAGSATAGMRPATARVLAVLEASPVAVTVSDIGDILAADSTGIPLKARTIQASLKELEAAGRAEVEAIDGRAHLWCPHRPAQEAGNAL